MRYFENLRMGWIIELIQIYGFINRKHVVKKFGVSEQIVSKDFSNVMKLHPQLMRYNEVDKCYWLKEPL